MLKLKPYEYEVIFSFLNHGGHVFDLSDAKFDAFTTDSVGVAVKARYQHLALSKGKSLEKFVREVEDAGIAATLLSDLLEYYELKIKGSGTTDDVSRTEEDFQKVRKVVDRIRGLSSSGRPEEGNGPGMFRIDPVRIPVTKDWRIIPAREADKPTALDAIIISQARSAIGELRYRRDAYVWPLKCEAGYLEGMCDRLCSSGSIRKLYEAILNYPRFVFPDGSEVAIKPEYLEPEEYPLLCQTDKPSSIMERVHTSMELPDTLNALDRYLDACGKFAPECMKIAARASILIGDLTHKCYYEPPYRPVSFDDLKPVIDICNEMYVEMKTLDVQPEKVRVEMTGPAARVVVMLPKTDEQAVEYANKEALASREERMKEIRDAHSRYARLSAIGGRPFDFVLGRLKEELSSLEWGVPVCPRENACWQEVLKPILNYTPRLEEFSVAGDDEECDYEVRGVFGEVFRLVAHDVPVEESDACRDILALTKKYIETGRRLAREWNSRSEDEWATADLACQRIGNTFRLKNSRPQINRMVDAMISAIETMVKEGGPRKLPVTEASPDDLADSIAKKMNRKERTARFLIAVTQQELAILLGYKNPDTVRKWESGERNCPVGYSRELRLHGGVGLLAFINNFRELRGITEPLKAIKDGHVVNISKLSEIDADFVLEFVRKKTQKAERKEAEDAERSRNSMGVR